MHLRFIPSLVAVCVLAAASAQSQASVVTYDFSGLTTHYSDYPSGSYTAVADGTEVFGSFSFDTNSTPYNTDGSSYEYLHVSSYQISVDGAPLLSYTWNGMGQSSIYQNTSAFLEVSNSTYAGITPYQMSYFYGYASAPLDLQTGAGLDALFSSGALQFTGLIGYEAPNSWSEVAFTVNSLVKLPDLSGIPEPGTALFGMALLGVIAAKRPRARTALIAA